MNLLKNLILYLESINMETFWKIMVMIVLIYILALIYTDTKDDTIETMQTTIDNMQIQLDAQTNHYNHCLWLDKDSIGVTKNGYMYSKYHKKYKISE